MAPLRVLPVIALLALSGVTAAAGQSPPPGLECGDTITADTTLDRDLTNCPSNGIMIGADDITLDLNGHSISGDGKPVRRCPRRQPCDIGVFNDRHNGVTVRNGSLRGFAVGVLLGGVRDNRLEELSSSRNQFFGYRDRRFVAEHHPRQLRQRQPDARRRRARACSARTTFGSSTTRSAATVSSACTSRTRPSNLVKGNVFVRNGDFGILLEADRNQLRGNRFVRDGVAAIQVGPGSRNVIAGNRIRGGGEGIGIEKGRGNVVARNVVFGVRHDGIRLGMWDPPIGSTRTVVRRNLVVDSGRDGFRVAQRDIDALLVGNVARRSGDDGFDIDSPSARLRANRAVASADLDIERR